MASLQRGLLLSFSPFIVAVALLMTGAPPAQAQTTFTVTSADDVDDTVCDASHCSLREAIAAANATAGADTIAFNIAGGGVQTIVPSASLPGITEAVTIDGYTQPGASPNTNATGGLNTVLTIEVVAGFTDGLIIQAANVTIRGLVISGIQQAVIVDAVPGTTIAGNFIGTNPAGTAVSSHYVPGSGIAVSAGATGLLIGGAAAADRNLIAGHSNNGIAITRSSTLLTSIAIQGNLIGTTVTGMAALGNMRGIFIDGSGALNQPDVITIGGATAELGNVIDASTFGGIEIYNAGSDDPSGTAITIEQNYIGVGVDSWIDLGNATGIALGGPVKATVRRNRIVGNNGAGINVSSLGLTGSGAGVLITDNSIFQNTGYGIDINDDGRTPNDVGDVDTGGNGLLNFPTLTSAKWDAAANVLTVTGSYSGLASAAFTVELFLNGNNGLLRSGKDGGRLLASAPVTTDGSGPATFSVPIPLVASPGVGNEISATFSHSNGYTSEFSDAISIVLAGRQISGTVTLGDGTPVSGVTVAIRDGGSFSTSVATNASGAYAFADLQPADYTITPSATGFSFTPSSSTIANLTADQARDFTAVPIPQIYTVNAVDDGDDSVCDVAHCSLRDAIGAANRHPGMDTIAFDVAPAGAVHTIVTTSALTAITGPLLIDGFTQPGAQPNTNAIGGLNAQLKIELQGTPSAGIGFEVASSDVTIRGLAIGGYQIAVYESQPSTSGLAVEGNYFGVKADGVTLVGGSQLGVAISAGVSAIVGGSTPAARNLFAGHSNAGINVQQGNSLPSEVVIAGNLIGTDVTGQQARPNAAGIVHGVQDGAPAAEILRIGGATDAERNVIAASGNTGILIIRSAGSDGPLVDRQIWNNVIGVAADGVAPLGNQGSGISVSGRVAYRIRNNVIAYNGGSGIQTSGSPTSAGHGIAISQNRIHENGGHGIDLGSDGRTSNDADDSDTGSNDLQNFPVLSAAREMLTGITVSGELHSLPNTAYTIELFTNGAVDRPGYDATLFLAGVTGTTDGSGLLTFTTAIADAIPAGTHIVATATDTARARTSEISDAVAVVAMPRYDISGTVTLTSGAGVALPGVTVTLAGTITASAITDAAGHYAFVNLPADGTYSVTPSLASYVFTPVNAQFNTLSGNTPADFSARRIETLQYLAEGATGPFWHTTIGVMNPTGTRTTATLDFLLPNGETKSLTVPLAAPGHVTVDPATVEGLEQGTFSTIVHSTAPIVASRTMRWGDHGELGAHAEQAVPGPRTSWYFGEGATGCFKLFYLLVNPNAQPADVTITYVRRAPETPVVLTYQVPGYSRYTVPVNDQPGLKFAEVAGQIDVTNGVPIVAERAMYSSCYGASWRGGHDSVGSPSPSTTWYLAEGATGSFFDFYLLAANFEAQDATIEVRYLLSDGSSFTKPHTVPAHSRLTIDVAGEDARLAATSVGAVVTSTNTVPIVVERAQWWPHGHWYEGHASAGATQAGIEWHLADAEVGGDRHSQAYLLLANTTDRAGSAQVTLVFDDGSTMQLAAPATLGPYERKSLDLADAFAGARGKRFGIIVESLGATPSPIVVELSIYNSTTLNGASVFWGNGTNVVAARVR